MGSMFPPSGGRTRPTSSNPTWDELRFQRAAKKKKYRCPTFPRWRIAVSFLFHGKKPEKSSPWSFQAAFLASIASIEPPPWLRRKVAHVFNSSKSGRLLWRTWDRPKISKNAWDAGVLPWLSGLSMFGDWGWKKQRPWLKEHVGAFENKGIPKNIIFICPIKTHTHIYIYIHISCQTLLPN